MMIAALACLATTSARAWEAGREGAICTLTHTEASVAVRLTFDPSGPLYTITVTRDAPWPDAPVFGIAFRGGAELTITTDRHVLSDDRRSITVMDSGFGNVLDGLARNAIATPFTSDQTASFGLAGAAPEVEAFRACATAPSV